MKFDDVIGEFGTYQKWIYFMVCLVGIPAAFQTMIGVFTLAVPEHRCAVPGLDNDTYKSQGQWHDDLVNTFVPWDNKTKTHSDCFLFRWNNGSSLISTNDTMSCNKWVYKKDPFESTFVTEHNLVCDDISLRTYANMILMGGLLAGSFILGSLSDMIGRKKVLIVGVAGQCSCGLGSAFAKSYIVYVILRFFTTFFGIGMFLSAFVIGMELVNPSKRKMAGIVIEFFWTFGLFVQTGVAYGLRNWSHLQIALSAPGALLLVYICILPESPRWLLSKGKFDEAEKVLRLTAARGKSDTSENVMNLSALEIEGHGERIWHMFKVPKLLIRSLIIFFNWFVASLVYYGISLNTANLSGDIYLNFFLSSLVELASYIFCLLVLDASGRKPLQCFSMLLSGLACICTLFPVIYGHDGLSWVTLVLSLVGKFGASAAFAIVFIFTAELFPTVMRNSGIGLSSVCARLGGILAPYIADIGLLIGGDVAVVLPLLIFGGASIVAGLMVLLLPETALKTLPETLEDAKNFGRFGNSFCNPCESSKPFLCRSSAKCIGLKFVCDGTWDCEDGFDEDPAVCNAAARPSYDDLFYFVENERKWMIPKLFNGANPELVAHSLSVASDMNDLSELVGLTDQNVELLRKAFEGAVEGDERPLLNMGMPDRSWHEVQYVLQKLLDSGFKP